MNKTYRALAIYVNRAGELADAVRRNIQKKGYIDNKTVIALNAFIIAENNVKELIDELEKLNSKLN